jgi:hypothetical protein
MKRFYFAWLVIALVSFTGCNSKSTPGGPGTTNPSNKKPIVGEAEDTFTLDVPSTTLKQGETKTITISIKRGKNIGEDVSLKVTDMPKGVTLEPAAPSIKSGDTEAKVTFKAADDAAVGVFTPKVTGHPTKGSDATTEFKLTVDKK